MPLSRVLRRGVLLLGLLCVHCADDQDGDDRADSNFIVGDASEPGRDLALDVDGEIPDLGLADVADTLDAELSDADDRETGAPEDTGVSDSETEDAGPDPCLISPEVVITATAAIAQSASLDGHVLEIRGRLAPGTQQCTDRACGVDDPCCNTCTASLLIDEVLPTVSSACFASVGCTGDECGLVCRPAVLGLEAGYVGTMRHDPVNGGRLELMQVRNP